MILDDLGGDGSDGGEVINKRGIGRMASGIARVSSLEYHL